MRGKNKMVQNKSFTIVKKIAKHGSQAIIVIPRMLEYELKTGTIVQLKIDVLKEAEK
jgi:hypothetical protein